MRVRPIGVKNWRLAILVLGLPVCFAACAPTLRLDGPIDENTDEAGKALGEATQPCANLPQVDGTVAITADVTIDGASTGSRVRTRLWLAANFGAGSLRLEPIQAPPTFVFTAKGLHKGQDDLSDLDGSVIFSNGSRAIQQESSRELLQGLLGVPLSAAELLSVILGCPSLHGGFTGYMLGPNAMRLLIGDLRASELFVRRDSERAPWNLVAFGRGIPGRSYQWRVEFGNHFKAHFRHFRVRSQEWHGVVGRTFDVSFSWNRIDLGATLDQQLFARDAPSPRPHS